MGGVASFGDDAEIKGGGIYNAGTLTVSGCTFKGNEAIQEIGSDTAEGGGIYNTGTLAVTDCTLSDNSATANNDVGTPAAAGGGIYNTGTLTISGSTFRHNSASASGAALPLSSAGGIFNAGTLTLNNSAVSDNSTSAYVGSGGGIENSGMLLVTNSTISDNTAVGLGGGGGGGIDNGSTVTILNSTLSGNSADDGAGGAINNAGTLTITNSTLSGNKDVGGPKHDTGQGGGINNTGSLTVTDSTISANSAGQNGSGAGIYNAGKLTANMSIFANRDTANLDSASRGTFLSLGHNLFSDKPDVALSSTDLVNTDPLLGPLANNGGPTFTQALVPGSPAIDAGVAVAGVTTDQRGVHRPQGPAPDIGAFEVVASIPPTVVGLTRVGIRHQPAQLVLSFSAPLDPARATDLSNYTLIPVGPGGRSAAHPLPIPIRFAVYDPSTRTVTLTPFRPINLHLYYRLTINGTAPGGVAAGGTLLDGADTGSPGSDYVAVVHKFGPVTIKSSARTPAGLRSAARRPGRP